MFMFLRYVLYNGFFYGLKILDRGEIEILDNLRRFLEVNRLLFGFLRISKGEFKFYEEVLCLVWF